MHETVFRIRYGKSAFSEDSRVGFEIRSHHCSPFDDADRVTTFLSKDLTKNQFEQNYGENPLTRQIPFFTLFGATCTLDSKMGSTLPLSHNSPIT